MPEPEEIDEILEFRKIDDYDRLYFTPTRDQFNRLKASAEKRHPEAGIPIFYDNFDDELTVRMKCKKGGWNQSNRLMPGEQYTVTAMMKTMPVKGTIVTFLHVVSVDGPMMEVEEEKKQRPIKRKATPVPTSVWKAAKKPAKKQEVKVEDVDEDAETEADD